MIKTHIYDKNGELVGKIELRDSVYDQFKSMLMLWEQTQNPDHAKMKIYPKTLSPTGDRGIDKWRIVDFCIEPDPEPMRPSKEVFDKIIKEERPLGRRNIR